MTTKKNIIIATAESFIGTPYKHGGQNYQGIDCSGMVCKCLQAADVFDFGTDKTAHELWIMFRHHTCSTANPGCLVFWFNGDRATHVGVCISPNLCISATTKDPQCQCVQYHPLDYRFEKRRYVDIY